LGLKINRLDTNKSNLKYFNHNKMKKTNFVLGMVAAAGMSIGLSSCGCTPSAKLNDGVDSVAYAFGVLQGTQFAAVADSGTLIPDEQIDLNEFLAGFLTAVKRDSSALKMTPEEADSFLREYFDNVRRQMMEKQQAEAQAQKEAGEKFLAENGNKEGVITTESGLQYQVLTPGEGESPKPGDRVLVKYRGTLLDGTEFDANDSASFSVNGVVPGFREALQLMAPGAKYQIWFPSNLGYGDRGTQGIPGGATLSFELELVSVESASK
jgi:FKBP-type peptidyl-prolyl cis-trans isomerase FkpA/FKBP-type peptidyl-prolyl cis-trans isomerase FklB